MTCRNAATSSCLSTRDNNVDQLDKMVSKYERSNVAPLARAPCQGSPHRPHALRRCLQDMWRGPGRPRLYVLLLQQKARADHSPRPQRRRPVRRRVLSRDAPPCVPEPVLISFYFPLPFPTSSRCMTASGSHVRMMHCNGLPETLAWEYTEDRQLRHSNSGKCLTVPAEAVSRLCCADSCVCAAPRWCAVVATPDPFLRAVAHHP